MSRHARKSSARHARPLIVMLFVFGFASPFWSAQAANADGFTPDITSVTQLADTGSFITNEATVPVEELTVVTSLPDTTVVLSDSPVASPVLQVPDLVASTPQLPAKQAVSARGELTFTSARGCQVASDYASGVLNVDARAYVENLLSNGWSIRISCIKGGHSTKVHDSENVSLHTVGAAFDIDQVNGQSVSPTSPESNRLYRWMKAQDNSALPWEVGGPHVPSGRTKFLRNQGQTGGPFFSNSGHKGHWHFGFKLANGTFSVPNGSVDASSAPDPQPAPASPQTPAFVIPPPLVKEETVQLAPLVIPSDQPDPNGTDPGPQPEQPELSVTVDLPPAVDAPSVVPPEASTVPDPGPITIEQLPSQPIQSAGDEQRKSVSIDPAVLEADYTRLSDAGVLPIIQRLAQKHGIPYEIGLALPSRETHSHNSIGDNGHGFCWLQIDNRSHGEWLAAHDWQDPEQCFEYGFAILQSNLDRFDGDMFRALAAYNSGGGNVNKALRSGDSAEARTAHHDYASDTLARADYYRTAHPAPSDSSATSVALPPSSEVQQ